MNSDTGNLEMIINEVISTGTYDSMNTALSCGFEKVADYPVIFVKFLRGGLQ